MDRFAASEEVAGRRDALRSTSESTATTIAAGKMLDGHVDEPAARQATRFLDLAVGRLVAASSSR